MKSLIRIQNKIIKPDELSAFLEAKKNANETIGFTNGCFDILHKGHVEYLAQASDLADNLIVGLNSDQSVKRQNKGVNRPINSVDARLMLIAALECVSAVVVFDEDTPLELIKLIQPDVLIKGADYDPAEESSDNKKYIVGRDVVLANNGEVKVIPLVQGYSTTTIVKKLNNDN